MSLFIFDKDGTLCPGVPNGRGGTRPPNKLHEQTYYPDVLDKITELKLAGHKVAVASNQGGVAFGIFSETEARALVEAAARYIGASCWLCSPYHPKGKVAPYNRDDRMRKPGPGMLLEIMHTLDVEAADTVMVGDWDSDREAAAAAGCGFIEAWRFFDREQPREKAPT